MTKTNASALVCATVLLLSCAMPGYAGTDWEKNPICRSEEFIDQAGFQRCRDWIKGVQQPSMPGFEDHQRTSCCSEADAYEADDFAVDSDGAHFAIITRDYPEAKAGDRIFIPPYKFNEAFKEGGNPTGHGIVFMRGSSVLCYFTPSLQ